jgi:DNA-directed RNA polymerase specialized sigma24 family protein/DNA-binding XRE family transcriptional regulator
MPEAQPLLARALSGDADALSALLKQAAPSLRASLKGRIGRRWQSLLEADDVLQVTFVEAFLSAAQCTARDMPAFCSWLERIAKNNLTDAIRELDRAKRPSPRKRIENADSSPCEALIELLAVTSNTPSRSACRRETCEAVDAALKDEITRLARKEIKSQTGVTKRLATQHRRDLAALKRTVAALQKEVAFLAAQEKKRVKSKPVQEDKAENVRFSPRWVKIHRDKLGLSAAHYGKLVGVSGLSIYNWETGKARPRAQFLPKLAAVRGLGKREAIKRLEMLEG